MITKENVTVYQCSFCKKKLFVKGAMERHEKWCTHNPDNFKKCTGCMHMEEAEVFYKVEVSYDIYNGEETRMSKAFRCRKLDKLLYPMIVEKKGLPGKYPETFKDQQPMPKECEHYSTIWDY